jgi:hypothetical protein
MRHSAPLATDRRGSSDASRPAAAGRARASSARRVISLLALFCAGIAASFALADDSTAKKVFILGVEPGKVRTTTIGREPEIERYWYLPFTLVNEDQEDHSFFLEVSAESDKKREYRNLAHPIVKEKARRRLGVREGETFWDAHDLTTNHEPTDTAAAFPRKLDLPVIKAGEKVRCVAIFRGPDPEADKIVVSFRGLTNDVQSIKTGTPNERKLVERIFQLTFERPGDEFYRTDDAIEYVGRQWVTVERTVKSDLD